jgi:hypothetical protein
MLKLIATIIALPILLLGHDSDFINHYGNPDSGQVRVDSWVNDKVDDTKNPDRVQGVVNPVAVTKVKNIHVNVIRLEDQYLNIWARSLNTDHTKYVKAGIGEECISTSTPRSLRTRANITIWWTDGTKSIVGTLSKPTEFLFCRV